MKRYFLIFLMIAFISGCAAPVANNQQATGNVYTGDDFSIEYPQGWIVAEAGNGVSFLGNEDYFANIVVSVEEDTVSLSGYWEDTKEDLEKSEILIGTQVYQDLLTIVNGKQAIRVDYDYKLGFDVEATMVLVVEGGKGYSIIYQTEEGNHGNHLNEFENSLDSFEIL